MSTFEQEDLFRVRPIDSEIASLAASLGPDIKTPTPIPGENHSTLRNVAVSVVRGSGQTQPTSFRQLLALLSLSMSFVTSTTPILFITGSTRKACFVRI